MDVSQEELAERAGCSRGYLSEIESGKREPGRDILERIANFFEIPTALLLPDSGSGDPEIYRMLSTILAEVIAAKMILHGKKGVRRRK